jgi:molybdopterin-guanine dinucleotide biosynthesis protein A
MLSGAVLSGGKGSRMGAEKGLVMLGGLPLISYSVRTMEIVTDEVVVAVAPGMRGDYAGVLGSRVLVVEDAQAVAGPLDGLVTALAAAKGDYVIVSPCDTPFLRADVCQAIALFAKGRDGAVPRIGGYIEPLHCAFRRRRCLAAFQEALEEGVHKLSEAYKTLDMIHIEEEDMRALDPHLESFWNINTAEDLDKAEQKLRTHLF